MAEKKTNSANRSGGSGKSGDTKSGSTGRSKSSKKALDAEIQRQQEEAIRRSKRRRHVATVIMFAVGILLTLAAVIPGSEGEGCVLVRGQRAPILGRVCMDQIMVDVTDIPGASVGDEVVLLGRQGDEEISAMEMAGWLDTISYEVLCSPSARVPRLHHA